jgi:hypothetical protein
MHECDLEPKEAEPRRGVDQVGAGGSEIGEGHVHVVDLIGDVVQPRAALREEPPHGRIVAQSSEQLDTALADTHRRGLDTLGLDTLAMLEAPAEQALVGRDRLVEVRNRHSDVMNAPCFHPADVTVAPMPRRFVIGALAVVALAGGCGGGSKSNGEAGKSAEQVVTDAKQAALAAKAVHVSGSITDAGRPLTLDLTIVKDKGGKGTMAQSGLEFEIVRVGDTAYIRGSDAFLRRYAGPAAAQLLHGKWLKGSATSGNLAALAPLTDITRLFNGALGSHGKLRNKVETEYNGEKVVAIEDTTQGGTLYVAWSGTPYPVAIVGGKSKGAIAFDRWDESASISAPKGAIDMSALGKG